MPKPRYRKGGQGKKGGNGTGGQRSDKPDNGVWQTQDPAMKNNALFETYYRTQGIVADDEFPSMLDALRAELPTTFRVTGSRAHAETINNLIKDTYIPTMQNVEWEGTKYDPPQQIPWYPGSLAWSLSAPKRVVRKTEPFKRFQRFLVGETEVGNLSRQEAVSMIPPLFMDVQPHHICLDMCAAPGSKTAQIIEALNPHHTSSTGLLIANDSDYKRTHMLVHQTGRMPSRGLVVTNMDAAAFPVIKLGNGKDLKFDRILADVPCSGDGTLRKNLEIWKKWGCNDGNSLHILQLRILDRGMRMLKPGGRLVYSTCSFNPVEDEAVVAAAMNAHPGQFTLVDVSTQLPQLKRRKGLTEWKVATQTGHSGGSKLVWHESHETYRAAIDALSDSERDNKRPLPQSVWPPSNASELGLENCMRLVPHDQDTGGFFVCVLEKAGSAPLEEPEPKPEEIPVPILNDVTVADEAGSSTLKRGASPSAVTEAEPETKRIKADTDNKAGPSKKKFKRDLNFKEDPFSFVDPNHEEVKSLSEWFQLGSDFEKDKFLVRNDYGDPLRTLYLANGTVKEILENNDYSRLRIVYAGVKGFIRQDSSNRGEIPCKWRIPGDGISEIVPYLPESIIRHGTLAELKILIREMYPPVERFSNQAQAWMEKLELGNVIVRFDPEKTDTGRLDLPLYLPVWKAKTSLSLLIDKKEKSMLSLRTFGEDFCPATGVLVKKDKEEGEGTAAPAGEKVVAEVGIDEEDTLNTDLTGAEAEVTDDKTEA